MSLLKEGDNKKWINSFLILVSLLLVFLLYHFFIFAGARWDLEARFSYWAEGVQLLAFFIGLAFFIICVRVKSIYSYLNEVYFELLKVIWPDKESSVKVTIVVVVGVAIVSFLLVLADLLFNKVLSYLY